MKLSDYIVKNRKFISLVLSLIFLIIVLNMIQSDDVNKLLLERATFENISSLMITISIILFVRSFRWILLIRAVTKSELQLRSLLYYSFMSQFYNSFLFFGTGDVVKVLSIKFDKIQEKMADIITMTVLDRILDIILIVIGGFIALVLLEILELSMLLIIVGIGASLFIIFIFLVYQFGWHKKAINRWPTLKDQVILLWKVKSTIIIGLILTTFVWILEGVKIYQITNSFTLSKIELTTSIYVGLAAWLGTLVLIPVSGSLGSKEYLLSRSLKNQGVIQSESGLISVFDRLMTIVTSGIIFLILYFLNKTNSSNADIPINEAQSTSLTQN